LSRLKRRELRRENLQVKIHESNSNAEAREWTSKVNIATSISRYRRKYPLCSHANVYIRKHIQDKSHSFFSGSSICYVASSLYRSLALYLSRSMNSLWDLPVPVSFESLYFLIYKSLVEIPQTPKENTQGEICQDPTSPRKTFRIRVISRIALVSECSLSSFLSSRRNYYFVTHEKVIRRRSLFNDFKRIIRISIW